MKWRTLAEHTIESDRGYTILQCTANGVPTGRYLAFAGRTIVLGGYDLREEAQECCEQHLYQTAQALTA